MDSKFIRMKIFLMMFKVFGLAPWNVVRGSFEKNVLNHEVSETMETSQLTYSKLGCVYPIFLVIINVGVWIAVCPHIFGGEYAGKTQMTVMFGTAISFFGNIVANALRLMLCVKQNTAVELFNRLTNIDVTIVRLRNGSYSKSNKLFFILLFSTYAFSVTTYTLSSHLFGSDIFQWLFINILPTTTISWFMIQYIVMVKLVKCRFHALNRCLLDNSSYFDIQSKSSLIVVDIAVERYCSPKITDFRRTYNALSDITRDISAFYSLPILPAIAHLCFGITYSIYYFAIPTVSRGELHLPSNWIPLLSSLLGMMLPIVMLVATINKTNFEMRQTADDVHELLERASTSQENKIELRQFSIELLQRNVEFTACGIFALDCTILRSIFSTIIICLVIIIKFQSAKEGVSP